MHSRRGLEAQRKAAQSRISKDVTDRVHEAVAGFSKMQINEEKLVVQVEQTGSTSHASLRDVAAPVAIHVADVGAATEVLCLTNIGIEEELKNEYDDILEDIKEECSNFGCVKSIEIPRPIENVVVPGVGKAYIQFESIINCQKAHEALGGRYFSGRILLASYFDPERYQRRQFK